MVIVFSGKVSNKHQERLKGNFPNQSFVFCENMNDAKRDLSKAEILVTYGDDLNSNLIGQAVNLKWIMVMSAGMDQMPFEAIHEKGIMVTNSRGIHKTPMAEYAIYMLLQVYRQGKVIIQNQGAKKWDKSVRLQEISGKTMLVVGTGAIGQEVARLSQAFQMKTYGISRSGRQVGFFDEVYPISKLGEILPKVDIVVSVLPSTVETRGMFKSKQFQQMANHAIFLNMGRGDVLDEDDLLEAVQQNKIAHAVLDVFKQEPLPVDHPFWIEENITITPHLSGLSPNYTTRALEIFRKNLYTYIEGRDTYLNKVDIKKGY